MINVLRQQLTIAIGALLLSTSLFANVDSNMNDFFTSLGYSSNVTAPHAYQGQAAGYYSGGSLYIRGKVRNMQFANVTAPHLDAGCGGINLTLGGFSFISKNQLVDFGKNIMSAAAPYFFNLAMQTYAPQILADMNQLQKWAQDFNANNLSTCQAAVSAAAALWPKHSAAQRQICEDIGRQHNFFSDWASARQGCSGGDASGNMNKAANTPEGKKLVTRNMNVVWEQLMTQSFLNDDKDLAQFFMSLSGTVIFDKEGNPRTYSTLLTDTDTIAALMNGGNASLYKCDNTAANACLNLSVEKTQISAEDALVARVQGLLTDLAEHVQNDEAPTAAELSFLQKTSMPVLKMTEVALETRHAVDTTDLATLIAQDLLVQYLNGTLQNVHAVLIQADKPDALKQISASLTAAMQVVNKLQTNVNKRLLAVRTEVAQSMDTQKQVMGALSARLKDATGL